MGVNSKKLETGNKLYSCVRFNESINGAVPDA